jgi:hypothetical protein
MRTLGTGKKKSGTTDILIILTLIFSFFFSVFMLVMGKQMLTLQRMI